jgi:hypothetical protein
MCGSADPRQADQLGIESDISGAFCRNDQPGMTTSLRQGRISGIRVADGFD